MAQVEGHGLRGRRQNCVATGLCPFLEPAPIGGVGPAGVGGLRVAEARGDAKAASWSRSDSSSGLWSCWTLASSVVMVTSVKLVINSILSRIVESTSEGLF